VASGSVTHSALEVSVELRPRPRGQLAGQVVGRLEGRRVAWLSFAIYEGERCQISLVYTQDEYRRRGYATQLVVALRERFPTIVPARFNMTPPGKALAERLLPTLGRPTA
jgi:GNAT superfamily N-acetyltransferase